LCRPQGALYCIAPPGLILMIPFLMQGFRFLPPPAYQGITPTGLCVVSPLRGFVLCHPQGASYCVAPPGLILMIPFLMQGLRFSPPPAYQGIAHKGLCIVSPTGGFGSSRLFQTSLKHSNPLETSQYKLTEHDVLKLRYSPLFSYTNYTLYAS